MRVIILFFLLFSCNSIYKSTRLYHYQQDFGHVCLSLQTDNTFEYYYTYGMLRGYTEGVFVETKDSIFLYSTIEYNYFRTMILSLSPEEQKSQLSYWDSQTIFYKQKLKKINNKSLYNLDSVYIFGKFPLQLDKTAKKVCGEIFKPIPTTTHKR